MGTKIAIVPFHTCSMCLAHLLCESAPDTGDQQPASQTAGTGPLRGHQHQSRQHASAHRTPNVSLCLFPIFCHSFHTLTLPVFQIHMPLFSQLLFMKPRMYLVTANFLRWANSVQSIYSFTGRSRNSIST